MFKKGCFDVGATVYPVAMKVGRMSDLVLALVGTVPT